MRNIIESLGRGTALAVAAVLLSSTILPLLQGVDALDPGTNLSGGEGSSVTPEVAVSGSNIYVAWQDSISDNNEILFAASSDNGAAFG
ncbi:MAG: hypothetical protein ACREBU_19545, partial [Nitrososphaera sp.]